MKLLVISNRPAIILKHEQAPHNLRQTNQKKQQISLKFQERRLLTVPQVIKIAGGDLRLDYIFTFFMVLELLILVLALAWGYKSWRRKKCSPNYTGKTVWITGASSGIGQFLAYEFSRCGADLILTARNISQLERVKSLCVQPEKVKVIKLDMTDFDTVEIVTKEIIAELEKQNKRLDIVVQNAGVSMRCAMEDYEFGNHLSLFNVNVHGPYRHIQCFLKHMIKNKSGHIVGVTSAAGKLSTIYRTSYAGSKHAFIGILDSLRSEVFPHGITVTNVMPGYVATNISINAFGSGSGEKFGETDKNIQGGQDPNQFARIAVRAIYMKENEVTISHKIKVPVGIFFRNLCPDLVFWAVRRQGKGQSRAQASKKDA